MRKSNTLNSFAPAKASRQSLVLGMGYKSGLVNLFTALLSISMVSPYHLALPQGIVVMPMVNLTS